MIHYIKINYTYVFVISMNQKGKLYDTAFGMVKIGVFCTLSNIIAFKYVDDFSNTYFSYSNS